MAYDPVTGKWKDEELDVEKRLTGLLSKDSDYLKQAEAAGVRGAHQRGLLNSSIAVGAAEGARIERAFPIASQDASQAQQRHLLGRQQQGSEVLQGRDITSREKMQGLDIGSQERMLGTELTSREKLAGQDIESRERMQGTDIASRERMQQTDVQAQQWLAQFDATTRERLQTLDATTRMQMQQLDIESQERIANLNVSVENRGQASRIAAGFELAYMDFIGGIMNNPDIPADVRQQYFDHANTIRENNFALVEQLFGIDIEWGDEAGDTAENDEAPPGATPPPENYPVPPGTYPGTY